MHLCQDKRDERTHMIETKETGLLMLELSSKLTDKSLNTISSAHDATANDVRYHLRCWSAVKREAALTVHFQHSEQLKKTSSKRHLI